MQCVFAFNPSAQVMSTTNIMSGNSNNISVGTYYYWSLKTCDFCGTKFEHGFIPTRTTPNGELLVHDIKDHQLCNSECCSDNNDFTINMIANTYNSGELLFCNTGCKGRFKNYVIHNDLTHGVPTSFFQ